MLINIKSLHPTLLSLYRVLMLCLEQWYCVVNKCTLPLLLALHLLCIQILCIFKRISIFQTIYRQINIQQLMVLT